ncbi:hypothetical protein TNCV_1593461 [Trichonephila clavipes]|nr:hypothetical protein TNCV_1593461 [Trichonephila clavipes]
MNLYLAIPQLKEKHENFPGIADKLSRNYEDVEFEITREVQIKSDDSITFNNQNTNALSTGMDKTRSLKKISPLTQRSNISGTSEQISALSAKTTLVKRTKYTFYGENGGNSSFIYNTDFEEEEKELIDIFHSSSEALSNTSNIKTGSYNKAFPFKLIPTDASPVILQMKMLPFPTLIFKRN